MVDIAIEQAKARELERRSRRDSHTQRLAERYKAMIADQRATGKSWNEIGLISRQEKPGFKFSADIVAAQITPGTRRAVSDVRKAFGSQGAMPTEGVYIIGNLGWPAYLKIGKANDVGKRVNALSAGAPSAYLWYATTTFGGIELEQAVHDRLGAFHQRGEWFKVELDFAVRMLALQAARFLKKAVLT